jgi:GT2 family glycosyltransferase
MKTVLSILICSLTSRKHLLDALAGELVRQCQELGLELCLDEIAFALRSKVMFKDVSFGRVEILTASDNKHIATGTKRNMLVNRAKGKYVVFIDDDDWVPTYYISQILASAEYDADCMAMNGIITTNGANELKWFISKDYPTWSERGYGKEKTYLRTPNHISPIKRELVLQVPFKDITSGEDSDFSARILPLIKTQSFIIRPMYHYRFSTHKR